MQVKRKRLVVSSSSRLLVLFVGTKHQVYQKSFGQQDRFGSMEAGFFWIFQGDLRRTKSEKICWLSSGTALITEAVRDRFFSGHCSLETSQAEHFEAWNLVPALHNLRQRD